MDYTSFAGILIGISAIVGALIFESGSIMLLFQPGAAMIVFGGTLGAALINFSSSTVSNATKEFSRVFSEEKYNFAEIINQISDIATISRQEGSLVLENIIDNINDDFLRKGIQLAIDNTDRKTLQDILNSEINMEEEKGMIVPMFYEALGGYAPTFGIIGAVIGLIQVMSSLESPSQLGYGIATSFVATLYGVGTANLIFLPVAGKLRFRLRERILYKKLVAQGILSVHKAENPIFIKEKLTSYLYYSENTIPERISSVENYS